MTQDTIGKPMWLDLTVPDPEPLKAFYGTVIGWTPEAVDMGGYDDFAMNTPAGESVAGLCYRRGENARVPPVWMAYVVVPSLADALAAVRAQGGTVVDERTSLAIIQDPAGAYLGLWQHKTADEGQNS